jgi:cytochrome P450
MTDLSSAPSFLDPAVMQNPFPLYQWAIANAPIMPVQMGPMTVYMVSSYELVSDATARVEEFSNGFIAALSGAMLLDTDVAAILAEGWPQMDTLLTADPPGHTRYRKLVNLAFSMPKVNAMEGAIREKVTRLIDAFIDKGECEFVSEFAVALPVQVICEQLGFDLSEHGNVKRWSDAFADRLGHMIGKERELECAREVLEFQHAVKIKIDERREKPTSDLLSDLVNARLDGEVPLNDAEILSIAQQLMVAGNETTTHALAGGMVQLAQAPDQLAKLRANPKLIGNLVEEVLRTETPTAAMWRVVTRDTTLGGVDLPKGAMMMLRYAAANRDPARFIDPDTFDIERSNARSHLAFGRGIHMCVGNMLSRKEMTVAFEELINRLDNIAVQDGAVLEVAPNLLLRGLISAPLRFTTHQV